jgi:opacity protein-like surface antigen
MKRMAIFAMFLVSLVGITQVAGAATTSGSKSILFGFDNLNLSGFESGVGIGIRYFISDGTALRPTVGFSYGTTKDKQEKPTTTDTEDKRTSTNISFSLALEKHMKAGEKVSPYMGLGAGIAMGSDKFEPSQTVPGTTGDLLEDKITSTSFSGFGLLGFDWSFMDNLSLGGEYRLGVVAGTDKRERTYFNLPASDSEDKTTDLDFGISTGSLYLSFSF